MSTLAYSAVVDGERWRNTAPTPARLREQRGVKDSTLDTYQTVLVKFMTSLGADPAAYTASAIRMFVLESAKPHGRHWAQSITVATRAYLKYLVAMGQCPIGREHAVPSFANWQLATTPRFLGQSDIDRLLATCEGESRLRDRAVMLLLARLGLRASEVAHLTFGDIDWKNGRITLVGKVRREEWLPLPQDVGDAILAYIERARPRIATMRVFLTDIAPIRPLSGIAVKCIVRRALDRAGIESVHRGAHVLRHSAATAMLRNGAIHRRKATNSGQVSSDEGRCSGGRMSSSRRYSTNSLAAPCGARAVLLPWNTDAEALKPTVSVSTS